MALFQSSVLKKYLAAQEHAPMHAAFGAYLTYFHDPMRRLNIRASKEEQFQEGFLRELFVKILGYTINPDPDYNLTTELKNIKDSKKTDGAILKDGKALAVIELKGTDTKDLEKIRDQAFNYKNNQPDCIYVITSNFEKLRFYIHNAVDFVEFSILHMQQDEFRLMWLLLQKDNLLKGIPAQIKAESLLVEEQVTKKLYSDYSAFKQQLWQDMVAQNPGLDELQLYKKSQKLLDRFLFIFFAEDKGLLPPNSISEIIKQWETLEQLDSYVPLYDRFKLYFGFMNTGRPARKDKAEIHAYNGGLFAPDPLLDSLTISDILLRTHVNKLTEYDFESEVDTNILGHIFEHSLNDIENVRASLEGTEVDKSKTKRKKDGVFYTPKYITKYIVDNTVGKLCTEKKAELEIIDEEFSRGKVYKTKEAEQKRKIELRDKLNAYRNWLLQLAICDPACGSGAFLNQVLEFLMAEHRYLDELESMLFGSSIVFPNVENHILENNIFGVDINEESVEIARLSLWLRTAQKGRKLSTLSSNIKVGNSLIDDPEVAGDLAFNWQDQFPKVFAKGGFDVVVGNPPYVSRDLPESLKKQLSKEYFTAQYQVDLYVSFIEKGVKSLSMNGLISYIVPNSWLKNMMMSSCREFVLRNLNFLTITPNLDDVFEEATVDTMIFIGKKEEERNKIEINEFRDKQLVFRHFVNQDRFKNNEGYIFDVEISEALLPLFEKVIEGTEKVGDILDVIRGINPYDKYTGQEAEIISTRAYHSNIKKDPTFVPELKGQHVGRYFYNWDEKHYISYGDWLAAPRPIEYFSGPRIVFREILGKTLVSTFIEEDFKIDRSLYIARIDNEKSDLFDLKYILGILNSRMMAFYFRYKNNEFDNLFPKIRVGEFKELPIKKVPLEDQKNLSLQVSLLLQNGKIFSTISLGFQNHIIAKFPIEKLSTKLQNWPSLDFKGFLGELTKAKVKLSLGEEAEWMAYFNEQKAKAQALQSDITRLDREIDALVYELYGLTEEEIRIVEGGEG